MIQDVLNTHKHNETTQHRKQDFFERIHYLYNFALRESHSICFCSYVFILISESCNSDAPGWRIIQIIYIIPAAYTQYWLLCASENWYESESSSWRHVAASRARYERMRKDPNALIVLSSWKKSDMQHAHATASTAFQRWLGKYTPSKTDERCYRQKTVTQTVTTNATRIAHNICIKKDRLWDRTWGNLLRHCIRLVYFLHSLEQSKAVLWGHYTATDINNLPARWPNCYISRHLLVIWEDFRRRLIEFSVKMSLAVVRHNDLLASLP